MRNDYTDITVVLDRSGSMDSCKTDAEGGLNTLVRDQQKQPGVARFTLVQFDDRYEVPIKAKLIQDVPYLAVVPRGSTALLDAVGKAINETGERLAKLLEADRPAAVIITIITDGDENSSREFTYDQIKSMVQHQTEKYNWQFAFVGANIDAFGVGNALGVAAASTAVYNNANIGATYASMSSSITRTRGMAASGATVTMDYKEEERKAMVGSTSGRS